MKKLVTVNGQTFEIDTAGLRHGDPVAGVGEQCEGCGNALDADAEALLHGSQRAAIKCSACGTVYPLAVKP